MNDKKKAITIGVVLVVILLLAFSLRHPFYNSMLEMQNNGRYNLVSLQAANIISIFLILAFSAVFSALGFRKAKEKGYNAKLWAVICFFSNVWGYWYLLLRKKGV